MRDICAIKNLGFRGEISKIELTNGSIIGVMIDLKIWSWCLAKFQLFYNTLYFKARDWFLRILFILIWTIWNSNFIKIDLNFVSKSSSAFCRKKVKVVKFFIIGFEYFSYFIRGPMYFIFCIFWSALYKSYFVCFSKPLLEVYLFYSHFQNIFDRL